MLKPCLQIGSCNYKRYYYLNSEFIDDSLTKNIGISIKDRGFLLGDEVFTTLKAIKGKFLFLQEHLNRLNSNINTIKISNIKLEYKAIQHICYNLLKLNDLLDKEAIIRITVTRGSSTRGITIPSQDLQEPTLLISTILYQSLIKEDFKVCFPSVIRNDKSILAKDEALNNGYDDGILLNTQGHLSECTTANIFLVKEDRVITPPIKDGVLNGITRQSIINICREQNITILEESISRHSIHQFNAGFITNSAIGIQPLSQIDTYKLDTHNKIIQKINERYNYLINSVGEYGYA